MRTPSGAGPGGRELPAPGIDGARDEVLLLGQRHRVRQIGFLRETITPTTLAGLGRVSSMA
ncbi:MAG: hypothetical protein H7Y15_16195 [Pseudonocardia sp.]|nr:hypothetical protein [Pseudonocardia sp.]